MGACSERSIYNLIFAFVVKKSSTQLWHRFHLTCIGCLGGFVCTTICLIFWIFITSALEVFGIFRIYHWYRCRVKTSLHRSVKGRWFYFEITEYMYYCDKLKSTIYKRIKCLLRIITGQYLSNIEIRIVSLLWKLLRLGSVCLSLTVTVHTYNDLTNFKFNETA